MTLETDVELLLTRAAAPERARHVDLKFVEHVEQRLGAASRWSLLGLLPGVAAVVATFIVAPSLLGVPVNWNAVGEWLAEPLGLQLTLDAFRGLSSLEWASIELWPYALALLAVMVPLWMPSSDL